MLETHFSEMNNRKAVIIVFSISSPKEVIETLLSHFPIFKEFEVFVILQKSESVENAIENI